MADSDGTRPAPLHPEPAEGASQDAIVADIEETRERLSDTVDALRAKADVTGNAKRAVGSRVEDTKQRAVGAYEQVRDSDVVRRARTRPAVPAAAAAGLVLAVLAVVVWRRRTTPSRVAVMGLR